MCVYVYCPDRHWYKNALDTTKYCAEDKDWENLLQDAIISCGISASVTRCAELKWGLAGWLFLHGLEVTSAFFWCTTACRHVINKLYPANKNSPKALECLRALNKFFHFLTLGPKNKNIPKAKFRTALSLDPPHNQLSLDNNSDCNRRTQHVPRHCGHSSSLVSSVCGIVQRLHPGVATWVPFSPNLAWMKTTFPRRTSWMLPVPGDLRLASFLGWASEAAEANTLLPKVILSVLTILERIWPESYLILIRQLYSVRSCFCWFLFSFYQLNLSRNLDILTGQWSETREHQVKHRIWYRTTIQQP